MLFERGLHNYLISIFVPRHWLAALAWIYNNEIYHMVCIWQDFKSRLCFLFSAASWGPHVSMQFPQLRLPRLSCQPFRWSPTSCLRHKHHCCHTAMTAVYSFEA